MKTILPAFEVTYDDMQMALNFVHYFLKSDPSARITAVVGIKHKFLGQEDFVSADVNIVWQSPNATSESIYGPTVYHHQIEETTCRR
ncbi:hypothetical protein AVEN_212938-1 [Araneus ventricosus]|uniref:Uncharacterized protein n=1 Tax=Araneus ventricosus TaxID=182803 RepID=A0A4Y2I1D8_ARAVE|nr:hypothetical protein AVEN_212938-1 [Araneus ventricosus]